MTVVAGLRQRISGARLHRALRSHIDIQRIAQQVTAIRETELVIGCAVIHPRWEWADALCFRCGHEFTRSKNSVVVVHLVGARFAAGIGIRP